MPAVEWPRFLAKTPIERDVFSPGEQGLRSSDEGFWDPHQAKGLRTAQALLPKGRAFNIGFDVRDPETFSCGNKCAGWWPPSASRVPGRTRPRPAPCRAPVARPRHRSASCVGSSCTH